jgi:nucleoside-diphosphate-sugar epimerase
MKVLVTGATGFLGFRLVEKLNEDENIFEITATGRTIKKSHFVKSDKVKYITGNLVDSEFVNEITHNAEVVINCAALSSPWGKLSDFKEANIISQKNLIQSSTRNKVNKFIFISSPSVYFEPINKFNISENDPLPKQFVNNYAKSKFVAEELLRASSIPYVIFRPRALIGRGDHVIMPRLINAFDKNKLKIIGNGDNLVDLTPVSNVVDAILSSINNEKALNQTFNISNGSPVKLWDKINYVLERLGRKKIKKKVSYKLAFIVVFLIESISKLFNLKEPATTIYSIGILSKSFSLNIDRAREILKYHPKQSIDEAIDEFILWYKKNNN